MRHSRFRFRFTRLRQLIGFLSGLALIPGAMADEANPVSNFSVESFSVAEASGTATIVVELSEALASDVEVSVASRPDTAINGQDFYGFYNRVKFDAGETRNSVTVMILNDDEAEGNESFKIRLFNNTSGLTAIANNTATITIEDDDESGTGNCPGTFELESCIDDMARRGGGVVTLDAKTYLLRDTITLQSNVEIVGQGSSTVVTWDQSVADSINAPMFNRGRSGSGIANVGFKNMHLLCTVDTDDSSDRDRTDHMAIFIDGVGDQFDADSLQHSNITIENVDVSHCGGTGIHIKGTNKITTVDLNMYNNGWGTTDLWHNIYFLRARNIEMRQTDANSGGFFDSPAGHGLRMGKLENVYFENLRIEGNSDHGLHMNEVTNLRGNGLTISGNCAAPRGTCRQIACYSSICDYDLN